MKIIDCPLNGPSSAKEFICGGEVVAQPAQAASLGDWVDYVFFDNNSRGLAHEWWFHVPSNYWFIATRDAATDEFIQTASVEDFFAAQALEAGGVQSSG